MKTGKQNSGFLSLVAAILAPGPVMAADFEDGVPLSLAQALLGVHNAAEPILYDGFPDDFRGS